MAGLNRLPLSLLCLSLLTSQSLSVLASGTKIADLVLTHANVYTANPKQPFAETVAIKDQKFVFVGNDDEVKRHLSNKTEIIDLKGKQILPGFIDNHNHIFEAAS